MLRKIKWTGIILLLAVASGYATSLEQVVNRAVETAIRRAQIPQVNAQLPKEQLTQIPFLLTEAKEHAQTDLDLQWVDETDVVLSLHYCLSGYNPLEAHAATEEEAATVREIPVEELNHALHVALIKIIPAKYRKPLVYKPSLYPVVEDMERFSILCQLFMDEIYDILANELAPGKLDALHDFFVNDPD